MAWSDSIDRVNDSCLATFGRPVTYERQADGVTTVLTAVVTQGEAHEQAKPGSEANVFVRLSALVVEPAKGDKVTFDGKIHQVVDFEKDSDGDGRTLVVRYVKLQN